MPALHVALLVALTALVAGCGGEAGSAGGDPLQAVDAAVRDQVADAGEVDPAAFPKPPASGTLEDFGRRFSADGPQAVAASSVLRPPTSRLAFGLLDTNQQFAYGETVLYVQRRGATSIEGPIAAPADVLVTEARYRSQQAASEKDPFAAIYTADIPTPKPGIYNVLVVTKLGETTNAAPLAVQVQSRAEDLVPDVGERAPKVETDTLGSVKGDVRMLDTRLPPAPELARKSFADVVGKEPVALLFATPQLCQSRVCGPVTDEMLQLRAKYGDDMTFIHQEVYVDNDPNKGLREPLRRFNLRSEPWLFVVGRDGRVTARLEGSFGLAAFEQAIKTAL